MTKDISAKTWLLRRNHDGTLDSRYPNGDKPSGPTVVAPTLGTPSMGSTTASVPFSGGANYNSLIPEYRVMGSGAWNSLPSDTISPLEFTGLSEESDYEFRARANGAVASNTVTGKTLAGGTDLDQILFHTNFSTYTTGQDLTTATAAVMEGHGVISEERAFSGTKSVKMVALTTRPKADENYLDIGFVFENAFPRLHEGDEVWGRVRIYLPTPSGYQTGSAGNLKFYRTRVWQQDDSRRGYSDIYLSSEEGNWKHIFESVDNWYNLNNDGSKAPQNDVWETYEVYQKYNSIDGQALIRFWKNGLLVGETTQRNMGASTDYVSNFLFQTLWNGGVTQTEIWFLGEFSLAVNKAGVRDDSQYLTTDAGGRKYIGI